MFNFSIFAFLYFYILTKFHFVNILLFLAVMASENAVLNVEVSCHWLVVGDALGIVALYDATNLTRCYNTALLNHLVVADDAKYNIWSYY